MSAETISPSEGKNKEQITTAEAEEVGETALEGVPIIIDSDPARLIHEEFPSISPRPSVRVGYTHHDRFNSGSEAFSEQKPPEQNPDEVVEILNKFDLNEDDLLHTQRSIDRLSPGQPEQFGSLGVDGTDFLGRFQLIQGVARLRTGAKPDNLPLTWKEKLDEISSEQIGRDITLLARVFKKSLVDGSLTAYKDLQKSVDFARVESIEDDAARQKTMESIAASQRKEYEARDRKRQTALRYNERVSQKIADETLEAPYLLEREAVTLTDEDMNGLLNSPESERQKIIAELTDPYRLRLDKDAGPEAQERLDKESLQVGVLLESLPESWQRDLLAIEAWRFYMHKNISDAGKAVKALDLISAPEIKSAMQALHASLEGRTPELLAKVITDGSSAKALETLVSAYGSTPEELKREAETKKSNMRITINIRSQSSEGRSQPGITTIEKILLDSRRVLSAHEVGRKSSMSGADARSRSIGESLAGFDPYDVITDKPVYGTLVESETDKMLGDPDARWYGSCVITLRPEVTARSTFSWGDSARAWSGGLNNIGAGSMAFGEAAAAKVLFDKRNPERTGRNTEIGKEYIEAQILGGISADDIEAITIPYEEVIAHRMSLRALATEFPSIKFRCLLPPEKASEQALVEEKFNEFDNVEAITSGQENRVELAVAA